MLASRHQDYRQGHLLILPFESRSDIITFLPKYAKLSREWTFWVMELMKSRPEGLLKLLCFRRGRVHHVELFQTWWDKLHKTVSLEQGCEHPLQPSFRTNGTQGVILQSHQVYKIWKESYPSLNSAFHCRVEKRVIGGMSDWTFFPSKRIFFLLLKPKLEFLFENKFWDSGFS